MVNVSQVEGDIGWLEGMHIEEAGPKDVVIVTVKAIPKLDVAFFCQVARANEGICVIYQRLVIL
jgi:hypothetical protein